MMDLGKYKAEKFKILKVYCYHTDIKKQAGP